MMNYLQLGALKSVTKGNDSSVLYIKGDEFTDGSIRFVVDFSDKNGEIQHRTSGIWESTGFRLAAGTLFLERDISLSSIGSHLQTESVESGIKTLVSHIAFDDTGTSVPHTPILGQRLNRVVFSSNETGEDVFTKFELETSGINTGFRYNYYFKTGSVAATSPVTMTLSKGHAPGGIIFFQKVMPASQWSANTEVVIDLGHGISITVDQEILLTIESANNFSLKGSQAAGGNFFALDFQPLSNEDLVSLPTGTDRFLTSFNSCQLIIDNSGNIVSRDETGNIAVPPALPPLADPPSGGI